MICNPAYICENGHAVSTTSERCLDRFCSACGSAVISECPSCRAVIRGHRKNECGYYKVPAYCPDCGSAYPWTQTALQTAIDLLIEDDELPAADREKLVAVLPDVIVETPKSNLAAVRLRKAIKTCTGMVGEALRQLVIDFGCELVKKQLGL